MKAVLKSLNINNLHKVEQNVAIYAYKTKQTWKKRRSNRGKQLCAIGVLPRQAIFPSCLQLESQLIQMDWKHIYVKKICPKQHIVCRNAQVSNVWVSTHKPENWMQKSEFVNNFRWFQSSATCAEAVPLLLGHSQCEFYVGKHHSQLFSSLMIWTCAKNYLSAPLAAQSHPGMEGVLEPVGII